MEIKSRKQSYEPTDQQQRGRVFGVSKGSKDTQGITNNKDFSGQVTWDNKMFGTTQKTSSNRRERNLKGNSDISDLLNKEATPFD